jgi:hypothetical protein
MFLKALVCVVAAAGIAVVLLGLRQQRFEMMHEMAELHGKMNHSREQMWDLQVKIAGRVDPQRLAKALERAKLQLVNVTQPPAPKEPVLVARTARATRRD